MKTAPCEAITSERVGNPMYDQLPGKSGPVLLSSLDRAWRTSEYGRYFRGQKTRYTNKFPMSNEDALTYLGPDVCPQGHQDEFVRYLDLLCDTEATAHTLLAIEDEDRRLLYFVAKFHDVGELTHPELDALGFSPVGDIVSGQKTPQNRLDETRIRQYIFSNPPFDVLDPHFLARAEAIIAHDEPTLEAFEDSTAHLHEVYEAAHDLQSLDTAARAQFTIEHDLALVSNQPKAYNQLSTLAPSVKTEQSNRLRRKRPYFAIMNTVNGLLTLPNHFINDLNPESHTACQPRVLIPLGNSCIRTCVRLEKRLEDPDLSSVVHTLS